MRRVKTNRKYEATTLATSQETSTGAISEAKAILIVNGDLADEISPQEFFNGELFGDIPGAVTKIVMQSQERGSCGCAIFFTDEQSRDEYLCGPSWSRATADSSWENVMAEKYGICGSAA